MERLPMQPSVSEKRLIHIRGSSTDSAFACAPSIQPQSWTSGTPRGPSSLGTAAHYIWTEGIGGNEVPISVAASKFQVDQDALDKTMKWCSIAWGHVRKYFVPANCEVPLEFIGDGYHLTGHPDVLWENEDEARICDGKSGWGDYPHLHQQKSYAFLVCQNRPQIQKVRICVLRWALMKADWDVYTRQELDDWWQVMVKHLRENATRFVPGSYCSYCPRRRSCPDRTAALAQNREWMLDRHKNYELPTDPIEKARMILAIEERRKQLEKALAELHGWVKAEVKAEMHLDASGTEHGLPLGDGRELVIERQEREEIHVAPSVDILVKHLGLGDEEAGKAKLIDLVEVGKGALEKAIKASAGYRQKTKAWNACMEDLRNRAGCVTIKPVELLEVRENVIPIQSTTAPAIGREAGDGADDGATAPDFAGAILDRPDTAGD